MSDLDARFKTASEESVKLSKAPDNATKLKMYALFKQGSEGDVQGTRPGFTDLFARAKYDAWAGLKGTSKEEAQQKYIDLVESLKQELGYAG
ncbi:MAG: acyl-CoA-binding protein [Candidatus Competibacteraceae bacterium]